MAIPGRQEQEVCFEVNTSDGLVDLLIMLGLPPQLLPSCVELSMDFCFNGLNYGESFSHGKNIMLYFKEYRMGCKFCFSTDKIK